MNATLGAARPSRCTECGTELAPNLLSCPSCHQLVHADELKVTAGAASDAALAGDVRTAIEHWRRALTMLPPDSAQHRRVAAKVADLSRRIDQPGGPGPESTGGNEPKKRAGLGAAGAGLTGLALFAWKFKVVLVFLVTKAKLLVLGLTKTGTVFSMALSFGVYWSVWGWKFALGLVLSIYVHEMGHVAALRHLGIGASVPMFIPGIGAFVRLKDYPADPREDARVGLAGPVWGLGAALAAWGIYAVTSWPVLAAIARVGAWINLFNLLPVWQLDGARGFRALDRHHRWLCVLAIGLTWFLTHESLLVLLLITAIIQAATGRTPERSDRRALLEYAVLTAALGGLTLLPVPGAAPVGIVAGLPPDFPAP